MRKYFTSGDWTVIAKTGDSRRSYPLPRFPEAYAFEQDYTIQRDSFSSLALNTPDSTVANAILTSESGQHDIKMGMTQWSRTYQKVPATWDDYQSQNVTFPGIRAYTYQGGIRQPQSLNVTVRLHHEYYVLDPDNVLGSGCTSGGGPASASINDAGGIAIQCVSTLGDIPVLKRTAWGFLVSGVMLTNGYGVVDSLVASGGEGGWLETVPNTSQYLAWLNYADTNEWNSTAWDGTLADVATSTIGQFQFESSRLEPYTSRIICRVTPYSLAF